MWLHLPSMKSPCSPGQAAGYSEATCLNGNLSSMSNGTATPAKCCKPESETVCCLMPPFGTMSVPLPSEITNAVLLSKHCANWLDGHPSCLPEASHASPLAKQGTNARETTRVTAGDPPFALLERSDLPTAYWRTLQDSFLGDMGILEPFSVTWQKQGTMRDGVCYPLKISARPTSVKEYGLLLPTPTAHMRGSNTTERKRGETVRQRRMRWRTPTSGDGRRGKSSRDSSGHLHLTAQVHKFPTPTNSDSRASHPPKSVYVTSGGRIRQVSPNGKTGTPRLTQFVKMFPTPNTGDGSNRKAINPVITSSGSIRHINKSGGQSHLRLSQVVHMFPSPKASDKKRTGNTQSEYNRDSLCLVAAIKGGPGAEGVLNPDWVEWLMGWVPGWSSTEPLSLKQFEAWKVGQESGWWAHERGIPRLVPARLPNRNSRLEAIGNGQVSMCMATAWRLLTEGMFV